MDKVQTANTLSGMARNCDSADRTLMRSKNQVLELGWVQTITISFMRLKND